MHLKTTLRALLSGGLLYVAMAACGAAETANAPLVDGGPGAAVDAFVDALGDELGQPVGDANAGPGGNRAPAAPTIAVEQCDKVVTTFSGGTSNGAIHAFPGKSTTDLAMLHAVVTYPNAPFTANGVAFDHHQADAIYLHDGVALVICPAGQSVTFVLP